MFKKIKTTIESAGNAIKEQATLLQDSAKEKAFSLIEEWVMILPKLEECGLEITSFGTSVSISPTLEVELKGKHEDFNQERLSELIEEHKGSTPLRLVFSTTKTTYQLHDRSGSAIEEPLIIHIKVGISPEIRVFFGVPLIV